MAIFGFVSDAFINDCGIVPSPFRPTPDPPPFRLRVEICLSMRRSEVGRAFAEHQR